MMSLRVLFLVLVVPIAASAQDSLVESIKSSDAEVRRTAIDKITAQPTDPALVPQLFAYVGVNDKTLDRAARLALFALAHHAARPGAEKERVPIADAFVKEATSDRAEPVRSFAIEVLSFIGASEADIGLTPLLKDKELGEITRWSLDRIRRRRATVAQATDTRSTLRFAESLLDSGHPLDAEVIYRRLLGQVTDEKDKCAVLIGIARSAKETAVPDLIKALADEEVTVRGAARNTLVEMPGAPASHAIAEAIANATSDEVIELLLTILADRKDRAGVPILLRIVNDRQGNVRLAAIRALADIPDTRSVQLLIGVVLKGNSDERNAAVAALVQIPSSSVTQALISALRDASNDSKIAIVRALGNRGDRIATESILKVSTGADETLRMAVLSAAAEIKHVAFAPFVKSSLKSQSAEEVSTALDAAIPIANALAKTGQKQEAIDLYQQALQLISRPRQARLIANRLRKLGVDVDLSRFADQAGFVTNWWVLGPLSDRAGLQNADAVSPSDPIDVNAKVDFMGKQLSWKFTRLEDITGIADLERIIARMDNVGAYLYAEVTAEEACDVFLKMGSDDDIFCWLNGKLVHRNLVDRGLNVDQDVIPIRLEAGVNRILLKVLNGGAQWAVSLRITDRDNRPLQLKQRAP